MYKIMERYMDKCRNIDFLHSLSYVAVVGVICFFVFVLGSRPAQSSQSLSDVYKDKQVGEKFYFGRYPQSADGSVESIQWRVLSREGNFLLVISERGLDCKPYNEVYADISWADCTLRRWLNGEFLDRAFNDKERSKIIESTLENNIGPKTADRVFLLNREEIFNLFNDNDDRMCKPTDYAVKNGARVYLDDNVAFKGNVFWWLRSRDEHHINAWHVSINGCIYCSDVISKFVCVRPVLKLSI